MPHSTITVTLPYWEEENLVTVCGIANAGGGTIFVKSMERNGLRQTRRFRKSFETIPTLCMSELGLACPTEPVMEGMELCLEITVPPAEQPISYQGNYYLYSNGQNQLISEDQLEHLYEQNETAPWEGRLQAFVREEDFDPAMVAALSEEITSELGEEPPQKAVNDLLQRFGIKNKQSNAFTNIGVLLLHKAPDNYIPGAVVHIGLFNNDGTKAEMSEYIAGPLTVQLQNTLTALYERYLPAALKLAQGEAAKAEGDGEIAGGFGSGVDGDAGSVATRESETKGGETDSSTKLPPFEAVEEALLNALVHKNYESRMPIRVSVYPDRLYIDNVGRPPESWTLSDFLGRHNSRPRNPNLVLGLQKRRLLNGWGEGVSTMLTACKNVGLPAPEFSLRADEMDVCFYFGRDVGQATAKGMDSGSEAESSTDAASSSTAATAQVAAATHATTTHATAPSAAAATAPAAPQAPAAVPTPSAAAVSPGASATAQPQVVSPAQMVSNATNAAASDRKATFKERSVAAANRLDMTSTDEYILKVIETNGRVTAIRIADVLGVSESTVRRSFRRLREYGFIERIGSDKAGYWRLVD